MRVMAVASMLVFAVSLADAAEWRWLKATNNISRGWDVEDGLADVTTRGNRFEAKLYWKRPADRVRITLRGTVRNGRVSVTETVENSGSAGSKFEGTWKSRRWPEFDGTVGAESITLSDGWGLIGLTKSIKK